MLTAPPRVGTGVAARRSLQRQIAKLERELAEVAASTYPRIIVPRAVAHGGPRLLGLPELERPRDALAARLGDTLAAVEAQRRSQVAARARLEEMYADPPAHKGERVTNAEL